MSDYEFRQNRFGGTDEVGDVPTNIQRLIDLLNPRQREFLEKPGRRGVVLPWHTSS